MDFVDLIGDYERFRVDGKHDFPEQYRLKPVYYAQQNLFFIAAVHSFPIKRGRYAAIHLLHYAARQFHRTARR